MNWKRRKLLLHTYVHTSACLQTRCFVPAHWQALSFSLPYIYIFFSICVNHYLFSAEHSVNWYQAVKCMHTCTHTHTRTHTHTHTHWELQKQRKQHFKVLFIKTMNYSKEQFKVEETFILWKRKKGTCYVQLKQRGRVHQTKQSKLTKPHRGRTCDHMRTQYT